MLRIDWKLGYANLPSINIEDSLDLLPREECEFTFNDGMWYHIQKNGIVRYFTHSGVERNEGGFGGAAFTFLHEGKPKTLLGPWSGRASYLNMLIDTPVADVSIYNGRSYIACGILVSELVKLWDQDAYLLRSISDKRKEQGSVTASLAENCILKPDNQRYDPSYDYEIFARPV